MLLDESHGPWTTDANSPNGLWTELLDVACAWAAGARSPEQVAAGITRGLSEAARQPHASGGTVFSYDTSSGYYQDALYRAFENTITLPQFFMADWLARLRGEQSRGATMNCYDCANAVASLANALGCRAEVVSILVDRPGQIPPNFSTRPVSLIGEPANHLAVRKFPVHAVACVAGPTRHGKAFDACVSLAGSRGGVAGLPFSGEPGGYPFRRRRSP